jgi:hypothetical protein
MLAMYYTFISVTTKLVQENKKIPLFRIGALEDNTYLWIIPNSHRATYDPSNHTMMKPILIQMMKGDVIVCSSLMLHAGYGYGVVRNVRFHMYLLCKAKHLSCLYDVNKKTKKLFKESTKAGNEISVRFIEPQTKLNAYSVNEGTLNHNVYSTATLDERKRKIDDKKESLAKRIKNLTPGRK